MKRRTEGVSDHRRSRGLACRRHSFAAEWTIQARSWSSRWMSPGSACWSARCSRCARCDLPTPIPPRPGPIGWAELKRSARSGGSGRSDCSGLEPHPVGTGTGTGAGVSGLGWTETRSARQTDRVSPPGGRGVLGRVDLLSLVTKISTAPGFMSAPAWRNAAVTLLRRPLSRALLRPCAAPDAKWTPRDSVVYTDIHLRIGPTQSPPTLHVCA